MRAFLATLLLGGCLGVGAGGGASRPGVIPMLSELPPEASKRDAVLDSSLSTAGPEHRKGMTKKERKAETTAATAAAIIGSWFSHTQNVTLGTATTFDENQTTPRAPLREDSAPDAATKKAADAPAPEPPPDVVSPSNADLIPWIKLK